MSRPILRAFAAAALVLGAVAVTTGTASAAPNITANSVALNANANCSNNADLDIGMTVSTVDNETGLVTNAGGVTLGSFDQSSGFSGYDGVFDGYGQPIDIAQPEGTIIGSYASIGTSPLSPSTAAEWFVLYRCSDTPGGNVVLQLCFGDLGTCPQTAAEAVAGSLEAALSPDTVAPGGVVTVNGTGCFDPLVGALLLKDGAATGVGDVVTPEPDGSFSIPLTVPADATDGAYSVRVDCGNEQEISQSLTLALQVVSPSTTTTTAAAAEPATVTPAFTG